MKEKTFEELIDQYSYRGNYISSEKVVGEEAVLRLLQQVREATIEECLGIANKGYYWPSTIKQIESLQKDRIKLDYNERNN